MTTTTERHSRPAGPLARSLDHRSLADLAPFVLNSAVANCPHDRTGDLTLCRFAEAIGDIHPADIHDNGRSADRGARANLSHERGGRPNASWPQRPKL